MSSRRHNRVYLSAGTLFQRVAIRPFGQLFGYLINGAIAGRKTVNTGNSGSNKQREQTFGYHKRNEEFTVNITLITYIPYL
jgi:hypothetical protein